MVIILLVENETHRNRGRKLVNNRKGLTKMEKRYYRLWTEGVSFLQIDRKIRSYTIIKPKFYLSLVTFIHVFQVNGLKGAINTHLTLCKIIDDDIKQDKVKTKGSLTRQLRRVRQGIDLIATLFQNFLKSEYVLLQILSHFKQFIHG